MKQQIFISIVFLFCFNMYSQETFESLIAKINHKQLAIKLGEKGNNVEIEKKLSKKTGGYFFRIANLDTVYSFYCFVSKNELKDLKKSTNVSLNIKPELYLYNNKLKTLIVFNFNQPSSMYLSYGEGKLSVYNDYSMGSLDTVIYFSEELKPIRSLIFSDTFVDDSAVMNDTSLLFIQDFDYNDKKIIMTNYYVENKIKLNSSGFTLKDFEVLKKYEVDKVLEKDQRIENCFRNTLFVRLIKSLGFVV